jgi:O-antigen ligase
MRLTMSTFLIGSILAMGWLQPMHILPWVSFHSEAFAFVGVSVAGAHYLLTRKPGQVVKLPPLAMLATLLSLVLIAQFAFGKIYYFGDLAVYLAYLWAAVLAMVLGFNDDRTEGILYSLSLCILLAGLATVLVLLLQAFGANIDSEYVNPMPARRPGGNMGQANHAATLVVMAIASATYLKTRNVLSSLLAAILLVLLVAGLAMTESRTGLLSFLVVSVCFAVLYWRSRQRANLVGLGVLVGVQQLLWWLWPPFLLKVWNQEVAGVAQINSLSAMAGNLRLTMWREIWDAVVMEPWFGWGWGQLPKALNAVSDKYAVSAPFTYSHNVILDMAIGFGIPTALLLVVAGIYLGCRCLRSSDIPAVFFGVCLVVPIGIHSFLEFPYAYAYFSIPACLLLGQIQRQLQMTELLTVKTLSFGVAFCFATVLMSAIAWDYVSLEEDFRVARLESMRIGTTPQDYVPPQALVLTQLKNMALVARIKPSPRMGRLEIVQLREIALRFPAPGFQNRYALALALNNEADESLRQLKVIRAMHGERTYADLANLWRELATTDYPQLSEVAVGAF